MYGISTTRSNTINILQVVPIKYKPLDGFFRGLWLPLENFLKFLGGLSAGLGSVLALIRGLLDLPGSILELLGGSTGGRTGDTQYRDPRKLVVTAGFDSTL